MTRPPAPAVTPIAIELAAGATGLRCACAFACPTNRIRPSGEIDHPRLLLAPDLPPFFGRRVGAWEGLTNSFYHGRLRRHSGEHPDGFGGRPPQRRPPQIDSRGFQRAKLD
jgi:hypothetical protein